MVFLQLRGTWTAKLYTKSSELPEQPEKYLPPCTLSTSYAVIARPYGRTYVLRKELYIKSFHHSFLFDIKSQDLGLYSSTDRIISLQSLPTLLDNLNPLAYNHLIYPLLFVSDPTVSFFFIRSSTYLLMSSSLISCGARGDLSLFLNCSHSFFRRLSVRIEHKALHISYFSYWASFPIISSICSLLIEQ